ncbi:MAG: hydroxymethylbilane synthase, partial [Gaiellales bacterium]
LLEGQDRRAMQRVEAERVCVARIGAGCQAPVGAFHDGTSLRAAIAGEDGAWLEVRTGTDPVLVADELVASLP